MTNIKSGNFLAATIDNVVRIEVKRLILENEISSDDAGRVLDFLESYIVSETTKDVVVERMSEMMDLFPELFDVLACIDLVKEN